MVSNEKAIDDQLKTPAKCSYNPFSGEGCRSTCKQSNWHVQITPERGLSILTDQLQSLQQKVEEKKNQIQLQQQYLKDDSILKPNSDFPLQEFASLNTKQHVRRQKMLRQMKASNEYVRALLDDDDDDDTTLEKDMKPSIKTPDNCIETSVDVSPEYTPKGSNQEAVSLPVIKSIPKPSSPKQNRKIPQRSYSALDTPLKFPPIMANIPETPLSKSQTVKPLHQVTPTRRLQYARQDVHKIKKNEESARPLVEYDDQLFTNTAFNREVQGDIKNLHHHLHATQKPGLNTPAKDEIREAQEHLKVLRKEHRRQQLEARRPSLDPSSLPSSRPSIALSKPPSSQIHPHITTNSNNNASIPPPAPTRRYSLNDITKNACQVKNSAFHPANFARKQRHEQELALASCRQDYQDALSELKRHNGIGADQDIRRAIYLRVKSLERSLRRREDEFSSSSSSKKGPSKTKKKSRFRAPSSKRFSSSPPSNDKLRANIKKFQRRKSAKRQRHHYR